MTSSDTIVELEGINGELFNLTTGEQGVYLATEPAGCFYDPPVKVALEEPGNYPGARYLNHRILKRDIVFGVVILNDAKSGSFSWMSRDSEWRKAWAFDKPCRLIVTTPGSGTRYLKVQLFESPSVDMRTDPNGEVLSVTKMSCIAYDPFWYEDDIVHSVRTLSDTRFEPHLFTLNAKRAWEKQPKETLRMNVGVCNPTDQYIAPVWTVPGSTEPIPSFKSGDPIPWERAPFTQFVIPDYSWEDDEFADRRLRLPGLIHGENCVINTDRREEQISSESGTQVWARMNGVRFRNMIPPYTGGKTFEITASGCAKGQIITLRLKRPWARPWGLE